MQYTKQELLKNLSYNWKQQRKLLFKKVQYMIDNQKTQLKKIQKHNVQAQQNLKTTIQQKNQLNKKLIEFKQTKDKLQIEKKQLKVKISNRSKDITKLAMTDTSDEKLIFGEKRQEIFINRKNIIQNVFTEQVEFQAKYN